MNLFTHACVICKTAFTERDNESYDIGRILATLSVLVFLCLTIYVVVWQDKNWDMQSFGIGLGAVFASTGAYIAMKREDKEQ